MANILYQQYGFVTKNIDGNIKIKPVLAVRSFEGKLDVLIVLRELNHKERV